MVKTPRLVSEYLEHISGDILDIPGIVENFVAGRPGVYALFSKGHLYYIGLATNLKARLKQHQKDRHSGKWDRFSVYITTRDEHLKDLESLLLRVTGQPPGNRQNGKFSGATNQKADLNRQIKLKQSTERSELLGSLTQKNRKNLKSAKSAPKIGATALRAFYKNDTIKAMKRLDGSVRVGTTIYPSLSAAAKAITGHPTNGLWFWRIKTASGDWVRIKFA